MVLRVPFWLVVFLIGSGLTGGVSVASIESTSGLVDGFCDEPQTGKTPVSVSSLRLPLAAPSLDCV